MAIRVRRGPVVLGTLWLTAAVTATSVGLLAVHLVGNEVGGQVTAPLSDDGVQAALGSVSPTPTPSTEPAEAPSHEPEDGQARTVTTSGGVVSARCHDGQPTLLYATPADGYRTERTARAVTFVGSSRRVTLTLSCAGDELQTSTRTARTGSTPAPVQTVQPPQTQQPQQPEPTALPEPSEHSDGSGSDLGSDVEDR